MHVRHRQDGHQTVSEQGHNAEAMGASAVMLAILAAACLAAEGAATAPTHIEVIRSNPGGSVYYRRMREHLGEWRGPSVQQCVHRAKCVAWRVYSKSVYGMYAYHQLQHMGGCKRGEKCVQPASLVTCA